MKKLTTILISTVMVAALAVPTFAQQPGPGGKPGGKQGQGGPGAGQRGPGGGMMRMGGDRMRKAEEAILAKLNLTADQKAKIKALNDSQEKKMKALMEKLQAQRQSGKQPSEKDREAMRKQFTDLRDAHEAGLKKILTAAQFKKYEELRKAEMEKMRKEFEKRRQEGGGRPGAPPSGGKPGGKGGN